MKKESILAQAYDIIENRSEEKTREYGSFSEGMERAAQILSSMRGKKFDAHDMYAAMVALKFSRQSFNFKTDNLLDAVAYIGAWENYIQENESQKIPAPAVPGIKLADIPDETILKDHIEYVRYLKKRFEEELSEIKKSIDTLKDDPSKIENRKVY